MPRHVLPVLVVAQFMGTSPWFAGNAVLPELQQVLGLEALLGWTTSAVQAGFIAGTLAIAISGLADRVPAPRLFAVSAVGAGLANLLGLALPEGPAGLGVLLGARFLTGVFLAGVYPVGMKLAASWSDPARGGLGAALGFLVGALVVGTALPHGLRAIGAALPWRATLAGTSALAMLAGVGLWATVREGPFTKAAGPLQLGAVRVALASPDFRAAALGYFGHMWELYTVWALVPGLLGAAGFAGAAVSGGSFAVIGAGAVGCAVGGLLARRLGSARVAAVHMIGSGVLCASAPLWLHAPAPVVVGLLVAWGVLIVGDSPQLSALSAQTAPPGLVGSALTLVTCLGFGLTVVSIAVVSWLPLEIALPLLAVGPFAGARALSPLLRAQSAA